jgi:hypothetical protein
MIRGQRPIHSREVKLATAKQKAAARRNIKKAQKRAKQLHSIRSRAAKKAARTRKRRHH